MRRLLLPLLTVFALVQLAVPAGAQAAVEVPLEGSFTIQNGSECPANSEVRASVADVDGMESEVGLAITDLNGRFEIEAKMPGFLALGPAVVTVDCGLDDAVLVYDITLVEAESFDIGDYTEYAPVAVAALVGLVVIIVLARRFKARKQAAPAIVMAHPPAAAPAVTVEDDDEDPDYWFWDNDTENGPVKRLACLSHEGFYLHEVPAVAFTSYLQRLAEFGPDVVLANAFFAVPVKDIDEVHHRGTQLRVTYRRDGQKVKQVIDLGTEVTGVVDLLSRRVHVIADEAVPTA